MDQFDNSKTVVTLLVADSGETPWGTGIILGVRCIGNETTMYIDWDSYLGKEETIKVLTKIGSNKTETEYWKTLSIVRTTIYHPPSTNIPYLKKMMESNKFVAKVTPHKRKPITAVFNTTGMKKALKPIREACGW